MKYKFIYLSMFYLILLFSCSTEQYPEFSESADLFKTALEKDKTEGVEYFERSAIILEKIIEEKRVDNAYIYYNLANSWFYSENLGKAILNYKKAEKRFPSNNHIQNNLNFARLQVTDNIEVKKINPLIRTIFFIHFDLSLINKIVISIILLFIFFGCASFLLYKNKKFLKNILILSSVFLLLNGISLIIDVTSKPEGVIVVKEITARKGDSNGYEPSFTSPLHDGVEFRLLNERDGWYHIELGDGREGWIPEYSASLVD